MNGFRSLLPPAARIAAAAAAVAASLKPACGSRRPEALDKAELYEWEDECGRPAASDQSYFRRDQRAR